VSTLRLVALHPLAVQFAEVADAYERGRPEYALAVVGAIAAELAAGTCEDGPVGERDRLSETLSHALADDARSEDLA
jgi:hypothetical protein